MTGKHTVSGTLGRGMQGLLLLRGDPLTLRDLTSAIHIHALCSIDCDIPNCCHRLDLYGQHMQLLPPSRPLTFLASQCSRVVKYITFCALNCLLWRRAAPRVNTVGSTNFLESAAQNDSMPCRGRETFVTSTMDPTVLVLALNLDE